MSVAIKIKEAMARASWIRKMFEEGSRLKAQWGEDRVFDFSLGNPCLEPPEEYFQALRGHLEDRTPGKYMYMPNAGYKSTRDAVAAYLRKERGIPFEGHHITMTCGAGGGLNVALKALMNPEDEVILLAPYFPEYLFYIGNHGGRHVVVSTKKDFLLDLDAIEKALTPSTCALIINSPNNPTGRLYPQESINQLGEMLRKKRTSLGRAIYLISDEPYGDIIYDGQRLPDLLSAYENAILVYSYSKSLSLPGERLGYIAVHPGADDVKDLLEGMIFCNRTLGFVNAPATPQHIIRKLQGVHVNIEEYQKRRDVLCNGLSKAGYRFIRPEGAFYLFPETPTADDLSFVQALLAEGILAVPGSGFGAPGYFRIAYCVEERVIRGALPVFERVWKRYA